MRMVRAREFRGEQAWGALDLARIDGASVRLHWTDRPYVWQVNDGVEVFAVLEGAVEMRFCEAGEEKQVRLSAGDVFGAEVGDAHGAHPIGEARILVVERAGSV